jgi:hypothetical protein
MAIYISVYLRNKQEYGNTDRIILKSILTREKGGCDQCGTGTGALGVSY